MALRKKGAALVLAGVLVCSLGACGNAGTAEADGEESLPELKIGVDFLEPFFYKDENGDYAGIDVEIAKEACRRAGYEAVFVEIPWDEKDTYLDNGTVDCLWNAFSEDGREDQYLWTEPYMESDLAVMVDVRCPDTDLKTMRSVGGIAVRAGSKVEEILLSDTDHELTGSGKVYSCGSFEIAKTAFVKGYAGALACHRSVLEYIAKENPDKCRIFDDALMTVQLGVAFEKGEESESWERLNLAIDEMKEDGTIQKIKDSYDEELADTGEGTADEK